MNVLVSNFTFHNAAGEQVLAKDILQWVAKNQGRIFQTTGYSWLANGEKIHKSKTHLNIYLLPDASGFICIESAQVPNNCTLFDAYGKERLRLSVPWQLTTANNPASNAPPTFFVSTSDPYVNPADNKPGKYGVRAWVEFAGEYYFELDWRSGQFLWGKEVRF